MGWNKAQHAGKGCSLAANRHTIADTIYIVAGLITDFI